VASRRREGARCREGQQDPRRLDLKTRRVISDAFGAAWHKIADNFGTLERDIEGGQTRLAEAIMSAAREDSQDAERLSANALAIMALSYKKSPVEFTLC
jgi:hypothetical protein